MIEKTLYDYLKKELSVPVYMEVPPKPAKSFVTIQKIDGGRTNKINAATISIESYAESKFDACSLSELVKETMEEMGETSTDVYSCKLGGESDSSDLENKRYRYETIWNLYY